MSKPSCVNFSKYQGAGNDFILIDDRLLSFPLENQSKIRQLCDRKFGIGADGLILLQPSSNAHFLMRIFNSDGGEAESCGNGLRCLGRFLIDLGLPLQKYRIELYKKIVEISYVGRLIEVDMGIAQDLALHQTIDQHVLHIVNTGVPHAVIFVENIDSAPIKTVAPFLRSHPFFHPKGTNINFAFRQNDSSIRIRTFERGVEGETLACGTGACAVAVIAKELYSLPGPIVIHCVGGDLTISFSDHRIQMAGSAELLFTGSTIEQLT